MEFKDVVEARRSVRKFSDEGVGDDLVQYVLGMARLAPSWKNSQCWRFIVVRDEDARAKVASAVPMVNSWLRKAPVIVVVCADPDRSGYHNEMGYFLVDAAIASEHLVLAATDIGLGTCWIGLFEEDRLKETLDIPENVRVVTLLPLGHPANRVGVGERMTKVLVRSDKRKPLEELVHWERW